METWPSPLPRYNLLALSSLGLNKSWLVIGAIGRTLLLRPKPPPPCPPPCLHLPFWPILSLSYPSTRRPHSCNICLLRKASPYLRACPSLTWLPLTEDNSPPCL